MRLRMAAIPALRPGSMIPLLSRVRGDALPEKTAYRDEGCEVASRCTECPLERCKYDEPNGLMTVRMRERNSQIIALQRAGATMEELTQHFGLGRRAMFRVLAKGR